MMIFLPTEGETKIVNSSFARQKETSNKQLKPTPGIHVNRLDYRKIVHKTILYTMTKRSFSHWMSNNSTVRKKIDFLCTKVGLTLFSMLQHFLK